MNTFGISNLEFFNVEERNGYLISPLMKQVWACELDLLQELLRVCDKYKLRIYADSGTLIGAVRHKGFIPWDDDIDMAMPREDYTKLCEIAQQEFKHPYFFQTIYTDSNGYGNRHAQLRNSDTAAIPLKGKHKFNQGIFIDIFILDDVPSTCRLMARMVRQLRQAQTKIKIGLKLGLPHKIITKLYQEYEKTITKYAKPNNIYVSKISLHLREYIFLKSDYSEIEYRDFEHIKIPIPKGYDQILRTNYGDYMHPKQVATGHGTMEYDTECSYRDILGIK